jgi:hypothetical protein
MGLCESKHEKEKRREQELKRRREVIEKINKENHEQMLRDEEDEKYRTNYNIISDFLTEYTSPAFRLIMLDLCEECYAIKTSQFNKFPQERFEFLSLHKGEVRHKLKSILLEEYDKHVFRIDSLNSLKIDPEYRQTFCTEIMWLVNVLTDVRFDHSDKSNFQCHVSSDCIGCNVDKPECFVSKDEVMAYKKKHMNMLAQLESILILDIRIRKANEKF